MRPFPPGIPPELRSLLLALFRRYFPELHEYYESTLDALAVVDRLQSKLTPTSAFAGTSLNYERTTVCDWHSDCINLLTGLCLVIVLGNFNHRTAGHFLMNEARLVIELKHGDFFFNMSAYFGHRNCPIPKKASRRSIVLYTAAELFRWVQQGQRLKENRAEVLEATNQEEEPEDKAESEKRFQEGLQRLGNIERWGLKFPAPEEVVHTEDL